MKTGALSVSTSDCTPAGNLVDAKPSPKLIYGHAHDEDAEAGPGPCLPAVLLFSNLDATRVLTKIKTTIELFFYVWANRVFVQTLVARQNSPLQEPLLYKTKQNSVQRIRWRTNISIRILHDCSETRRRSERSSFWLRDRAIISPRL